MWLDGGFPATHIAHLKVLSLSIGNSLSVILIKAIVTDLPFKVRHIGGIGGIAALLQCRKPAVIVSTATAVGRRIPPILQQEPRMILKTLGLAAIAAELAQPLFIVLELLIGHACRQPGLVGLNAEAVVDTVGSTFLPPCLGQGNRGRDAIPLLLLHGHSGMILIE